MKDLIAQTINIGPTGDFSELGGITVPKIVQWLISSILVVASLIFFGLVVMGGVKWILSGGDKGKTEGARAQITAALVGLVIVFSAWAIVNLVGSIFGINIFNLKVPTLK